MDTTTVWTWEIHDGRPDETAPVQAADPLAAVQLYLQAHSLAAGEHTLTVRPAAAGCPFPEVTVEVQPGADGQPVVQPWADPVEWAEVLAAACGRKLRAEQRRYLEGPLVVGSPFWTDTPEWLRRAIPKARLRQVLRELAGTVEYAELATLEEVSAYLMAASFDAPLNHNAAAVYFWVAAQVLVQYGMVDSLESYWDRLDSGVLGTSHRELSEYQQSEYLRPLQRRIRASVVRHAPRREK